LMQLTEPARELIADIFAAYAAQPFEAGKEEQFRPAHRCRAEHRLALSELRQSGLLAGARKMWGETLYYVPADKLAFLGRHLFPLAPRAVNSRDIHITLEEGPGLATQLFRVLLFIAGEGLPFTGKGRIHKKTAEMLAGKLYLQDRHLQSMLQLGAESESYPLPAALALDLLLKLGLLSMRDNAYVLEPEVLESWLALSEAAMTDLLYTVIFHSYGSQEPAIQHFRYLISRPEFVAGAWSSLDQLLDWMESSGLAAPANRTNLKAASLGWLEVLAGCGWCRLGADREGGICFSWMECKPELPGWQEPPSAPGSEEESGTPADSEQVASSAAFIVQPDFEVLVPPEVTYTQRWKLACCAELLSVDGLWSFRLTRKKLAFASEAGMPAEETIAWLGGHALGGLPEEVEFALRQWGETIGRTVLSEVLLLACRREEDGDALAAHPRLQDSLCRLGPLHFTVRKKDEEKIRKVLTDAGLAPPREVQGRDSGKPVAAPVFGRGSMQPPAAYSLPRQKPGTGILPSGNPHYFLPPAELEADSGLFPDESSIPAMWSRDWHQYHSSTAQKIMEQALHLGIKVRIALEGQIREFIPSRLHGRPWRISGYLLSGPEGPAEEVELAAGGWKEMQLIIPRAQIPSSVKAADYVMIGESTFEVEH